MEYSASGIVQHLGCAAALPVMLILAGRGGMVAWPDGDGHLGTWRKAPADLG